jgi:dipeptidyl-peptidase-4
MSESFPRQQARTRRFTLGVPRAFTIAPDGSRVVFLRTKGGDDPVTCLWELDVASGVERLLADPRGLGADEADLPPQERARRERVRETAGGIVSYATDEAVSVAVYALAGQVFATSLGADSATTRTIPTLVPALDPRPDPAGSKLAYVHDGALRVTCLRDDSEPDVVVAGEEGVTYGLADFVSAEEMGRTRGYWWTPDGRELLAARVDESPVQRWYISDPANPDRAATEIAYPAAGTPNADVSLHRVSAQPAETAEIGWDHEAFPYLVAVNTDADEPLIVIQSRDQKRMRIIDGQGRIVREDTDPHWTDVIPGVPGRTESGDLIWTAIDGDTRHLIVGDKPVTPAGLQVRAVTCVDGDTVMFTASTEPTEVGLWTYSPGTGLVPVRTDPGVHSGRRRGGTTVTISASLEHDGPRVMVNAEKTIASLALRPNLKTEPTFFAAGEREVRTAVLFPAGHKPGTKLPVLLDPYGGPGAQRVLASRAMFLTSQWFADQGFAVVVADGRGTPGRGPRWDRAIAGDLAGPVLDDQVDALHDAARRYPDLDLSRVGIRGWSFGGYLSALAVFRRPDVFHAAIAGAPVTQWRLYDTHYTERYLGMPQDGTAYTDSSLEPGTQHRPLLLIHGLADDNVVAAHTLRLSSDLLAAGYPHSVLPLSGVTHMTPQEVVAENLLLLQARFLHSALNGG